MSAGHGTRRGACHGTRPGLRTAAGALLTVVTAACSLPAPPSSSPAPATSSPAPVATNAAGVTTVTIDGTAALRFSPQQVAVSPGRLIVTLHVLGGVPHTFTIPSLHVDTGTVDGGGTKSVSFTVATPGSYQFVCLFHRSVHMVGTLVVS